MRQERHHMEESVLPGWLRFLHDPPLHKREGEREKMSLPFAQGHGVDEVVAGKRNAVYQAEAGAHG